MDPNPSRPLPILTLQMDKGTLLAKQGLGAPQPFRTFTRVANLNLGFGQALGASKPSSAWAYFTGVYRSKHRYKPFVPECTLEQKEILLEQGFEAEGRKIHDRALRPRTYPNANLKF